MRAYGFGYPAGLFRLFGPVPTGHGCRTNLHDDGGKIGLLYLLTGKLPLFPCALKRCRKRRYGSWPFVLADVDADPSRANRLKAPVLSFPVI